MLDLRPSNYLSALLETGIPLSEKFSVGVDDLVEVFICPEMEFERYWSFWSRDDIDIFLLRSPYPTCEFFGIRYGGR